MQSMTLFSMNKNTETAVSNIFLDNYMKDANGESVKVYLYLLRCVNNHRTSLAPSDIADSLNMMESDVIRALKYWDRLNVLSVTFDEAGNIPQSLTINSLDHSVESAVTIAAPDSMAINNESATDEAVPHKTSYSAQQISEFKSRDDIKQLFYIIEKYIGRQITATDINVILYMKDSLNFSSELIEYLVEYCVNNNHISFRYMEKVALAWFEEGIRTVDDAESATTMYSRRVIPVMKAFGISGRSLTPAEIDFINRWYDEYAFDPQIITEACKRTILQLAKPSFSYTDGTLRKWHTAGVHTLEDIKKLDSGFRSRTTVPVTTRQPATPQPNKFHNFTQRTYDFDELEKKLLSKNKLIGNNK